ncbi:MAG TPA: toll/interleukin-1 receptor domain-containing protein [Pyrinomonadaceae bacterium]
MSNPNKFDVFISYSHKDSRWVRNVLLPKLESHSFSVLIDFRDFKSGALSVDEMQRAVLESKRVILVLSEEYIQSEWAHFENAMAQTLDPAAANRKMIPILHKDCVIPLRIQIMTYRDLRVETDETWQLLMQDLI